MSTNRNKVTDCDEALERKVAEIIDNELLKQNFEETCQRYAIISFLSFIIT